MGFQNFIEDNCRNANTVKKTLDTLHSITKTGRKKGLWDLNLEVTSFSDLIIRSYAIQDEKSMASIIKKELNEIKHIQLELMKKDIVIRGGITIGDIFHSDKYVFGTGLVDAYKLESERAVNPRIVIDQRIMKLLHEHKSKCTPFERITGQFVVKGLIAKSENGTCFVNYLHEDIKEKFPDLETLVAHKKLIIRNAIKFENNTRVLDKYLWLANYHNNIVELQSKKIRGNKNMNIFDVLKILEKDMPGIYDV